MASSSNAITEIYRTVIGDVINQMKEAFLDDNIDVDVLTQLKKEWEDKVNSSGCVELDTAMRQHHVAPPPLRTGVPMNRMAVHQTPVRAQPMQQNRQQQQQQQQMQHLRSQLKVNQMSENRLQGMYTQQPQQQQSFQPQINQQPVDTGMLQQQIGLQQPVQAANFLPMNLAQFQIPPGQSFTVYGENGQMMRATRAPNGQIIMSQLDGNGDVEVGDTETSPSSSSLPGEKQPSREEAMRVLSSILGGIQLDGGGGMSDSSSDEEDFVEEEDDPLRRIANRIGDGDVEDGDQVAEEEPLNSGDDQSDDEDSNTLFDADNVVMCQFEKVNRARTKWKFQLKDGIMHINNRDYAFQKCSGEAEW